MLPVVGRERFGHAEWREPTLFGVFIALKQAVARIILM
jgi:hypothetical protein